MVVRAALIPVALLLAFASGGHGCDTKQMMGTYLQCMKGELDRDYGTFEEEVNSHSRRAAESCFSSTLTEANSKERCVLALSDLDAKAWDRNGPLRECSICRTFAAGAIKAVLSTPPEDQKCIRQQIAKAVAAEASQCLSKKIPNFPGLPEIPDLEEGSFKHKEQVINSISDHILIQSRLSFCGERKPERAQSTRDCLKKPFPGFLQKHCNLLALCDEKAGSGGCQPALKGAKAATCVCIDEARDDLKRRIAGISAAIHEAVSVGNGRGPPGIGESGSRVDSCVSNIRKQLITPVNDWGAVIDSALNDCIKNKPNGQSLGIESLLNVGCRKIIADQTGTAATQIKTGFDFVNNLIDAMVERSRRFCGGSHCSH